MRWVNATVIAVGLLMMGIVLTTAALAGAGLGGHPVRREPPIRVSHAGEGRE